MNDKIKCYSKNGLDSYYNDLNPNMNIGKMLRVYLNKGYFKEDISNINLLCTDETRVIALKLNDKFYYFKETHDDIDKILERIPVDTFWSQLTEEKTITITPQEISRKAKDLGILKYSAATMLMQNNLEKTERDVAIFSTENGKLAVFPTYGIHNRFFVADNTFEFEQIKDIISTADYTL
ncbi:hypothetical protein GQ472_04580 [archaeon]|nr:hypothetical protein [archaeon]